MFHFQAAANFASTHHSYCLEKGGYQDVTVRQCLVPSWFRSCSFIPRWYVKRCCRHVHGSCDSDNSGLAYNTSSNPLTCLRFLGLCPLDVGPNLAQFSLYLCHYCPPHEYATFSSWSRLNLGMFEIVVVRKVLRNPLFAILQSCDAGDIACLSEVYTITIVFKFLSCGRSISKNHCQVCRWSMGMTGYVQISTS